MNSLLYFSGVVVVFSLVLSWVFLTTPGKAKTKLLLATILVSAGLSFGFSFDTYLGYPTRELWPDGSELIGVRVVRPTGPVEGAIYIWVMEPKKAAWSIWQPFAMSNEEASPRAFSVPFSAEIMKTAQEADAALAHGKKIILHRNKGKQSKKVTFGLSLWGDDESDHPAIEIVEPAQSLPKE